MLKARPEWEVEDVTNKIFGDDGYRTFPFIEVSMNCMLYLVDIEVEGEDDWRLTRRFICTTMNEVTILTLFTLKSDLTHIKRWEFSSCSVELDEWD